MPIDSPFGFLALSAPAYLALLLTLPLVVLMSRRSLASLGVTRRWVAVVARALVIIAVAFALADPEWVKQTDDQTVAFAIDQSDSVPREQRQAAFEFVERATDRMRPGQDRVAVLSFADRPVVDQLPRPSLSPTAADADVQRYQTDLASALQMGLAVFQGDTARRLVVLSDGNETRGSAADQANQYAALGIPIDVAPLQFAHDAEVLVEQLVAPAAAERDDVAELQLVVRSQRATTARLTLYRNDRFVDLDPRTASESIPITLSAGPNRFAIPVELNEPGVHRFRAVVEPDNPADDAIVVNNEAQAFTVVGAPTRVLIVSQQASDGEPDRSAAQLGAALDRSGIEHELVPLSNLPNDAAALADTSAMILSNLSALAIGRQRLDMLASYVRDQGGGLIVIGGDDAYSVGGYAHTPLEEILPVETARDKLKLLSLSMVIVIDRSGSMSGEKLAMARQAAIGSTQLLSRLDRLGVVAFDTMSQWVAPLQSAQNKSSLIRAISSIGEGGGTDMYPALEMAERALLNTEANLRHMIVLTDGQSAPGPFEELAERCRDARITISTIAVGDGADQQLLERIARLSGGRMYVAHSAQPLPQIFARETILASRSGIYEEPFAPVMRPTIDERILVGFGGGVPPLRGHVITAAKPLAQAPLIRPTEEGADPILAYWQVGLGRTVAFTSGLWDQWGPEWVAWPGFPKLWSQAVRYAARPGNPGDLEVETVVRGGEARLVISADHLPTDVQTSLAVAGRVIAPNFGSEPLALRRTAVDRYEASFPLDAPGAYLINLPYTYEDNGETRSGVIRTGVVQSYSPEYRVLQHNQATLVELAERTGGRVLSLEDTAAIFDPSRITPVSVRRPVWEDLLRITLLLFLLDVAVRRIAVSPAGALAKVRQALRGAGAQRADADSAGTLGALRGAKARTQADVAPQPANAAVASRPPATRDGAREASTAALRKALEATGADRPVAAQPTARPRPEDKGSADYASRLLRAKRRARGEDQESSDEG